MFDPQPTKEAKAFPFFFGRLNDQILQQTSVYVSQFSANHSSRNFTEPDSFIPERWIGEDERFAKDETSVWNPFSFGPRNCIGKK